LQLWTSQTKKFTIKRIEFHFSSTPPSRLSTSVKFLKNVNIIFIIFKLFIRTIFRNHIPYSIITIPTNICIIKVTAFIRTVGTFIRYIIIIVLIYKWYMQNKTSSLATKFPHIILVHAHSINIFTHIFCCIIQLPFSQPFKYAILNSWVFRFTAISWTKLRVQIFLWIMFVSWYFMCFDITITADTSLPIFYLRNYYWRHWSLWFFTTASCVFIAIILIALMRIQILISWFEINNLFNLLFLNIWFILICCINLAGEIEILL